MTERITPRNDSFFSSLIKDSFKMNESFKTDPSLATSARAANESGSYLCASNVTPTAVRFIVSVFLCLLCSCRMSSTQMTCTHFRKNRPKKRQKPAGCRSRIISKNRPVPIFGRSTGASLIHTQAKVYTERKVGIAIIDKFVDKSVLFIISYPWTECNHRKKKGSFTSLSTGKLLYINLVII